MDKAFLIKTLDSRFRGNDNLIRDSLNLQNIAETRFGLHQSCDRGKQI